MAFRVESYRNESLRRVKKLHSKKNRYAQKLFIAEGENAVEGLLGSGYRAQESLFSSSYYEKNPDVVSAVEKISDRSFSIEDEAFNRIAPTESPSGVLALVPFLDENLDEVLGLGGDLLFLNGVRDPGNAGNIIRIADASGFRGVVFGDDSVDPYNPKVVRSTAGSIFNIEIVNAVSINQFLNLAKEQKYALYAADPSGGEDVFDAEAKRPFALILGGETSGLPNGLKDLVDGYFTIPMGGKAESLNVSSAAAVMCFALKRRAED